MTSEAGNTVLKTVSQSETLYFRDILFRLGKLVFRHFCFVWSKWAKGRAPFKSGLESKS